MHTSECHLITTEKQMSSTVSAHNSSAHKRQEQYWYHNVHQRTCRQQSKRNYLLC